MRSRSRASLISILVAGVATLCNLGCGGTAGSAPPPKGITFSFGPEETVFNHTTDSCEPLDVPDIPAHAVRLADGSLMLADGDAPRYYAMFGADFSTLHRQCATPALVSDDFTNPDSYDNYEWIQSVYRDGNVIHALIHNEYHDPIAPDCKPGDSSPANPCWYNSITYAVSTDGGQTFTHAAPPGHLVAPPSELWDPQGPPPPYGYFNPSNIVHAQDGFYYAVFVAIAKNGPQGTCVIRTQTLSDPTSWRAWDGSAFNLQMIDPYTGPPSPLCTSVLSPALGQPTLTYNTYLAKYMIVGGSQGGNICGAAYSLSSDLIHWSAPQLLRTAAQCQSGVNVVDVYFSLIDHSDSSVNFETADSALYLYYTRFNTGLGTLDRDLVRVPMSITSH